MISKADKQWFDDLIAGSWLGSNGQQKLISQMQADYRGNCMKKLHKFKDALANDSEQEKYLPIIESKLQEFYTVEEMKMVVDNIF